MLVLWAGYPVGAQACGSLERAGFRVVASHPHEQPGDRPPARRAALRYPAPISDPDAFVAWVEETVLREAIDAVVPLDEDIVKLLSERAPDLGRATLVGPDAHQYRSLCDKAELDRLARRLGLDSPQTVTVEGGVPDGDWPPLPSIVKPLAPVAVAGKPIGVENVARRDAIVARLTEDGHRVLVQERIVGPRWSLHIVRAPGVFEHLAYRVVAEWPRECGPAAVKRLDRPPPEMVAAARALLDAVDYRGPLGLSFLERDGHYYPHDANLRLGATAGASVGAGFDFPRRAVEAVLGLPGEPFGGHARRIVYIRLDSELAALGASLLRRDRDAVWSELRRILRVTLGPRGVADPSPLDLSWSAGLAVRLVRGAGRRARSGLG